LDRRRLGESAGLWHDVDMVENTPLSLWSAAPKIIIGMLHLRPLPGSPRYGGSLTEVRDALLRDADALAEGGVHGLMIENFGDVPFYPSRVPAHVVATMTALAADVRRSVPHLPLGINVLRNDGRSALAIAAAVEAAYIRVNVLCGARVADQGILQSEAHDILRDRVGLRAEVKILADVDVKHSAPVAERSLADEVDDTLHRGLADGLIVSGAGTGKTTDPSKVAAVRAAAGTAPVFVGSGVTAETIADYLPHADGFIVGTALKRDGRASEPVDPSRVRELVARCLP
jgi:membrane complex biogenesis BtpA family protein